MEILLRLPVSDLMASRLVCPSWRRMVDAEPFRLAYAQRCGFILDLPEPGDAPKAIDLAAGESSTIDSAGQVRPSAAVTGAENGEELHKLFAIPYGPISDVLLRLPPADVLRMRAVCNLWRATIDAPSFKRDYARRRRLMPLYFFRGDPAPERNDWESRLVILNSVDLVAREPRRLLSFIDEPAGDQPEWENVVRVEGSCEGIVMLSFSDILFACNPSTRRWARLPPVHLDSAIVGFYPVVPCGQAAEADYRVLYRKPTTSSYWILSLSSGVSRPVDPQPALEPELDVLWSATGLRAQDDPPINILNCLYWRPQQEGATDGNIIFFDTLCESFGWITPPVDKKVLKGGHILEIDNKLGLAATDSPRGSEVDMWVLQDEMWVHVCEIILPQAEIDTCYSLLDSFGNTPVSVVHMDDEVHILVQCLHQLLHCRCNGDVLDRHADTQEGSLVLITSHMFQESISQHNFLPLTQEDVDNEGERAPFQFQFQVSATPCSAGECSRNSSFKF